MSMAEDTDMNTNLLVGGIFGAVAVTAAGSYAG
jgi:hypothetical protein